MTVTGVRRWMGPFTLLVEATEVKTEEVKAEENGKREEYEMY